MSTWVDRAELDEQDRAILAKRERLRDRRTGPRGGDFVIFEDGSLRRISYAGIVRQWRGKDTPLACLSCDWTDNSYHLNADGNVGVSGGNAEHLLISSLVDSGETRPGVFWFVHHDLHPMTGQGIRTAIPCRVFLARFDAAGSAGPAFTRGGEPER